MWSSKSSWNGPVDRTCCSWCQCCADVVASVAVGHTKSGEGFHHETTATARTTKQNNTQTVPAKRDSPSLTGKFQFLYFVVTDELRSGSSFPALSLYSSLSLCSPAAADYSRSRCVLKFSLMRPSILNVRVLLWPLCLRARVFLFSLSCPSVRPSVWLTDWLTERLFSILQLLSWGGSVHMSTTYSIDSLGSSDYWFVVEHLLATVLD